MADSVIDNVLQQVNIVEVVGEYLDLQKKGRNFWGICPFHQDSNPSMSVSPDKHIYKCFVCGAGGNVINFVADYEKISFGKALVKLANRVGIEVENNFDPKPTYNEVQGQIIKALNDANDYYQYCLSTPEGDFALKYAEARGLNAKIREEFKIGYAPAEGLIDFLIKKGHDKSVLINASLMTDNGTPFLKDRLTFGLTNEFGDIIGFSGRLLKGEGPKYINSGESLVFDKSSVLYNYNNARDLISREKEIYINEGFMDVIAMTKAGFKNSVAIMGTALTKNHIKKLKDVKVNLMLDSDEAGINATLKSIALLMTNNIATYVVVNENGKDPDEVVANEGIEVLKQITSHKVPALQFVYEVIKKRNKLESPEDIQTFVREFSKFLSIANSLEKDFYASKISKEFNLSNETVQAFIPSFNKYEVTLPKPKASNDNGYVTKKETEKFEFKKINYSYVLIRSILNKPQLREVIIKDKHNVQFADLMLINLWRYIQDVASGKEIKPTELQKQKVKEILAENSTVVETKEEFLDLINIVNNETKNIQANTVNVKLKKANSTDEEIEYLNQLRKLKQRK